MANIAVLPGSFDPMTIGHMALLKRALPLFDKIIVAIGINTSKQSFLPLQERLERIQKALEGMPSVEVVTYSGLTIDLCRQHGAQYILRGVRDNVDYEYERRIADINRLVAPDIQTLFLLADPEYAAISSSMVRELAAFGKDVSKYIV